MEIFRKQSNIPKEHQEVYGKQADVWTSTIEEFGKTKGIEGLQGVTSGDEFMLEISVKIEGDDCTFYRAPKILNRSEFFTTDLVWLKQQFEKYIEEQLSVRSRWKLKKGTILHFPEGP